MHTNRRANFVNRSNPTWLNWDIPSRIEIESYYLVPKADRVIKSRNIQSNANSIPLWIRRDINRTAFSGAESNKHEKRVDKSQE